jgi:hypothetical protein
MKRFTFAAVFSVSILAAWMIFQTSAIATSKMKNQAQNVLVPLTGAERKVAPLFDASGAVVSNPSGIAINRASSGESKIAPVIDAHGVVVSDPSGILLNAGNP